MDSPAFPGVDAATIDSLNIPILKFSYSTTSVDRVSPLGWAHISSSGDLTVSFERIRPQEASSFAKEEQRLRVFRGRDVLEQLSLDSLAREAAAEASHPQNSKPQYAIIVKSPCLAIRYPARNNQVRRFQIKFPSDADYSNAISILSRVGCPITSSTVGTPSHPSSVRPFSSSSHVSQIPTSSTLMPLAPNATSSGLDRSRAIEPYQARPWTSSLMDARPHGSFISSFNNNSMNMGPSGPAYGRLHTVCGVDKAKSPDTVGLSTSTTLSPMSNQEKSHAALRPTVPIRPDERPATAPLLPKVDSLSQILPPRRELPFAKPRPKQQRPSKKAPVQQAGNSTQLGTSSSFLVAQSRAAAAATTHIEASTPRMATSMGGTTQETPNPSANCTLNRDRETASAQAGNYNAPLRGLTFINNSSVNCLGTTSGIASDIPRTSSIPSQTLSTNVANPIPLHQSSNLNDISPSDLSSYLSTPAPERSAMVESWVCRQLENDAFLALCQDVEAIWRRIAFGQ
ncbi:hypothetical protein FQN50_002354 [Emmonsiellopsis sp. PD_5]|nr:hypothetical protein FQN50_002354 [Emmonsiellopsis sp. PD_5]